jgi:hypothetical protein
MIDGKRMHSIVTSSTAAMLLVHALIGCGWQHGRHCPQCDTSAAMAVQSTTCCDHEHGTSEPSSPTSAPCNCRFECQRLCISLPPQKTHVDVSQLTMPFGFVATDCSAMSDPLASPASWERASERSTAEPPLALHLLHQSLLI